MRVLICTAPPGESAAFIKVLLDERLIGCANILPGVRSLYRWEGEIQDDAEEFIVMETSDERCADAMKRLETLHPYSVPKIVALAEADVNAAYLKWLREATAPKS